MSKVQVLDEQEFQEKIVQRYTDIIGEKLGGQVLAFSDEWFAAAENLIKPKAPIRDATRFTHSGAWYDGWETRRHNTAESDWVVFKMGVSSASLIGCEVDTAFFNGNHAPAISVEATTLSDDSQYASADWDEIIPKIECGPSQKHFFVRADGVTEKKYTHVRIQMYPDGGIARFRLYGEVHAVIPLDVETVIDTASAVNGGVCVDFSDQHFGSADNLLLPGRGHDMSDGWETKRSRTPGHIDYATIRLGFKTNVSKVVVDTAHFRGNFPQYVTVEGASINPGESLETAKWETVVEKTKMGPDAIHEFELKEKKPSTHVKITLYPDGGVKRFRVFGTVAA
ncbi:hypothetical protein CANARDRAFT_27655 [[Candida] arabinofermentans NRRL YB-2248]|uniref:allantoicase n=1 Tax=[Candida] arabinofermentans NRRL YB-2248 TaxID=983967 RepID=A0A1E4T3Y2_9ASCO|nr:hypothetical protein CANARDRAFT_27655 [[Candida] arabinofermentans NRRL YB-2248]